MKHVCHPSSPFGCCILPTTDAPFSGRDYRAALILSEHSFARNERLRELWSPPQECHAARAKEDNEMSGARRGVHWSSKSSRLLVFTSFRVAVNPISGLSSAAWAHDTTGPDQVAITHITSRESAHYLCCCLWIDKQPDGFPSTAAHRQRNIEEGTTDRRRSDSRREQSRELLPYLLVCCPFGPSALSHDIIRSPPPCQEYLLPRLGCVSLPVAVSYIEAIRLLILPHHLSLPHISRSHSPSNTTSCLFQCNSKRRTPASMSSRRACTSLTRAKFSRWRRADDGQVHQQRMGQGCRRQDI